MRQQYHTRKTSDGSHTWDVRKLIATANSLAVQDILLSDIRELDENYWYADKAPIIRDIALHAKLINESDLSYPIILCADGRVMDGMHRCCKALILDHKTIKAVRFDKTPPPDYIDVDVDTLPYDDNFKVL